MRPRVHNKSTTRQLNNGRSRGTSKSMTNCTTNEAHTAGRARERTHRSSLIYTLIPSPASLESESRKPNTNHPLPCKGEGAPDNESNVALPCWGRGNPLPRKGADNRDPRTKSQTESKKHAGARHSRPIKKGGVRRSGCHTGPGVGKVLTSTTGQALPAC